MEKVESAPTIVYKRPTTGIFPYLPASWVPYAELMRIDRPGGFITFYLPCLLGIVYATAIGSVQPSLLLIIDRCVTILLCCVFARGASCTWNDSVDRDFDRKVARCRVRPISRGAVTRRQAHIWGIIQTVLMLLLVARMPTAVLPYMGAIISLAMLYPFAKRFTYYPQAVLGSTFGVGSLLCARSVDFNPLQDEILVPSACIVGINACWSMIYDTIYAHQDVADDIHVGVKGMAVKYQNSKVLLSFLSFVMVSMLATIGVQTELGLGYFVFAIGGTSLSLAVTIKSVNLKDEINCGWWFSHGYSLVGMSILSGLLIESLMKSNPEIVLTEIFDNSTWLHAEL